MHKRKRVRRSKGVGNLEESTSGMTPKKFMHEDFYGGTGTTGSGPEGHEDVSQKQKNLLRASLNVVD